MHIYDFKATKKSSKLYNIFAVQALFPSLIDMSPMLFQLLQLLYLVQLAILKICPQLRPPPPPKPQKRQIPSIVEEKNLS